MAEAGPESAERADLGWRLLAFLLACALVFAAAVMIIAAADISDLPLESEVKGSDIPAGGSIDVYEGSATEHTLTTAAFFASGGLAAVAAVLALAIAITGRFNGLLWLATGAAIALGAGAVVLNNL